MLKFFTRLEKTRNFVLLIFAILMVGSLVFFYTPARNAVDTGNLSRSTETAASVSGEKITVGEVVRQKESYSQFSQGRSFPSKMIIDGMISGRITRVEAERLGLTASDAEVAAEIRKRNKGEDGKPFDQARYEQAVMEQFGSISGYEQTLRDELSGNKLEAYITAGVTVSEQEVLEDFQRKNTKFDLSYVSINPTELSKTITPTDQELRDYFEKNKASYYISVPQKKIRYVFVNTSKIGQKLQITDADLRTEYDALAPDKKIGGVLGQEIVLRIPKPELDSQTQAKAAGIVAQLRAGGETVTEDAFGLIAKGQSENPLSARSGGKLTGPVRENINKPDDPYQQLLKMQPGQISEPISYQGRYFILRRGEAVPKTFEDAKKEIEVSLRNRRAYGVAAELAQKIADALKQSKDPQKTAAQFAAQANMAVGEMVRETGFVKPGDDVPNIGISAQFESGIEPLQAVGDVGEKTPIKDGFAVPMLAERKEPRDAEFDEVKGQITDIVKLERAQAQVEEIAKAIAASSPNAAALAAAASAKGAKAKDQKDYIIGSPLGEGASAASSEALSDAIYALKPGEVTKTPLKVGDSWIIAGVTARKDADNAEFTKQRSGLIEQMLSSKRSTVFSDYLAATKKRLEDGGYIKIYKEVIEKIDGPPLGSADPTQGS